MSVENNTEGISTRIPTETDQAFRVVYGIMGLKRSAAARLAIDEFIARHTDPTQVEAHLAQQVSNLRDQANKAREALGMTAIQPNVAESGTSVTETTIIRHEAIPIEPRGSVDRIGGSLERAFDYAAARGGEIVDKVAIDREELSGERVLTHNTVYLIARFQEPTDMLLGQTPDEVRDHEVPPTNLDAS